MDYRKKWRTALLKQLRENGGEYLLSTRNLSDMNALEKMEQEGLLTARPVEAGVWKVVLTPKTDSP